MEITKYRWFHKYRIIILIVFFLGLWISWYLLGNIYGVTLGFDMAAPDLGGNAQAIKQNLLGQLLTIDHFVSSTFRFSMILGPVLICANTLLFIWEKKGYLAFKLPRKNNYKGVIINTILIHAFINGTTFYFVYILFLSLGMLFNAAHMEIARTSFDFLFGRNFSIESPYFYYVLDGFIKFFVFGFVYSLFSNTIALVSSKSYVSVIIPIIYYFGFSVIFATGLQYMPLAPVYTQGFTSFVDMPLWMAFTPMIIPVVTSFFIIIWFLKRKEKYVD